MTRLSLDPSKGEDETDACGFKCTERPPSWKFSRRTLRAGEMKMMIAMTSLRPGRNDKTKKIRASEDVHA